ncbi:hypothetical protein JXA84_00250 [candidate division WOR-3 bacterium]|nr:hypothetical protein [candidate division WOR-3 bacterium]
MKKLTIFFLVLSAAFLTGCKNKGDVISGTIGQAAEVVSNGSSVRIQQNTANPADSATELGTMGNQISTQEIEQMLATEEFYFTASRDPFNSPLSSLEKSNLLNPQEGILEGVISGPRGLLAIIRSTDGKHWLLRKGDRVSGGNVAEITPEAVTFVLEHYGQISTVIIRRENSINGEEQ